MKTRSFVLRRLRIAVARSAVLRPRQNSRKTILTMIEGSPLKLPRSGEPQHCRCRTQYCQFPALQGPGWNSLAASSVKRVDIERLESIDGIVVYNSGGGGITFTDHNSTAENPQPIDIPIIHAEEACQRSRGRRRTLSKHNSLILCCDFHKLQNQFKHLSRWSLLKGPTKPRLVCEAEFGCEPNVLKWVESSVRCCLRSVCSHRILHGDD